MLIFITNIADSKAYGVFYGTNGRDLTCPENDMADLASLYRNRGASIFLIRGKSVKRSTVLDCLRKQAKKCEPDDMLILAFSGHGCNDGISCGWDFILYNEIINIFNTSKACRKVIFVGACESGGMARAIKRAKLPKNGQIFALSSSRRNEYSLEQLGKRNSYFYERLLKGLKGSADKNEDRIITAKEIFDYISSYIRKDVSSDNYEHPTAYGRFNDNLRLISWFK